MHGMSSCSSGFKTLTRPSVGFNLMTEVVHCQKSDYNIYIGRQNRNLPQSKWANPFMIGKNGNRTECIEKYRDWIKSQPQLLEDIHELEGKVLGCWCKPQDCHGDILIELLQKRDILEY